jgi:hypothetical protein
MSAQPYFSVLITAYNRAGQLTRCIRSVSEQTFGDFEIVVVDDASTDATAEVLAAIQEPRMRVITHPVNRGISPARATTVQEAQGAWLVMLDSDWELVPESLQRLRALIDGLPEGVRMIRSCLRWDDGTVSPSVLPAGVTDYPGRLKWLEAQWLDGGSSDAAHCIHRDVFVRTNYPSDRRGVIEMKWETDIARDEPSLWVPDVLGLQHTDAANSATRETKASRLMPRLISEAPDLRWMAETMLADHGRELARYAPNYRRWLLESALLESLLCGDRRAGLRHFRQTRRAGVSGPQPWATLALGLIGPGALARAKLYGRQLRSWR